MYFANPWGLLALLSLPAIVGIHLYRRRFPPMQIAGVHLWGIETEVRAAGRRLERLPITATLLLELLAALLISLVLGQPKFGDVDGIEHLVVVLDNSASMQGKPEGDVSFRDAAINLVGEQMSGLGRRARATVILTGRQPAMLAGPAVSWDEARSALDGWIPDETRHEFEPAWDEAAQFAEQAGGRLLFITDRLPDDSAILPKNMEVASIGRPVQNMAITAAQWTFDSKTSKGSLFLRLDNLGSREMQATVRGRVNDRTLFSRPITVAPGSSVPLETELEGGLGKLTVQVDCAQDGLSVDNEVTLVEPKVRMLTVAISLPAEHSARKPIERALSQIPDVQMGDASSAQLVFGLASELPPSRENLLWMGIGPIDPSEAAMEKATTPSTRYPYLVEKRNRLLDGVLLGGVVWSGVQPLNVDVVPLISAGEHRLLGRLTGTRTAAYILNIDLARSNLTESPDWPIFIKNLVDVQRDNLPGLRRWNYPVGEMIRFRSPTNTSLTDEGVDAATLQLVYGDKSRTIIANPDGTVEAIPRDGVGIYDVRDDKQSYGQFAVNFFDAEESTLNRLAPGVREPKQENEQLTLDLDDPYSWVIMLGSALILASVVMDWRVLKKEK